MHVYANANANANADANANANGVSPQRISWNNIPCIRDNGVLYDW